MPPFIEWPTVDEDKEEEEEEEALDPLLLLLLLTYDDDELFAELFRCALICSMVGSEAK